MAFENVFQNIDFQSGNKMQMAHQNQLMNAIGQGIGNYERGQDRELKQRQLEYKRNGDFEQIAQQEINNIALGNAPTERGQAAIHTMAQTKSDAVYTDPVTQQLTVRPNPYKNMGGALGNAVGGIPNAEFSQGGQVPQVNLDSLMGEQRAMPPSNMRLSIDDLQQNPNEYGAGDGNNPYNPAHHYTSTDGIETYQAGGILADTPAGLKMEEESKRKLKDAEAGELLKRNIQGIERFSDTQMTAANFANRMVESTNIIDGLLKEDSTANKGRTGKAGLTKSFLDIMPLGDFGSGTGEALVASGATEKQQQYLNAAENWLSANLRKESGAVISPSEIAQEYKKYFPMPTDKGAVIEQKAIMRKHTQKGMIGQSAGAYQGVFGKKSQAQKPKEPSPEQIKAEIQKRQGR